MKLLAALLVCVSTPAMAFPGALTQPCAEPPPLSAQRPVGEVVWTYVIPPEKMNAQCNKAPGVIILGCTFLANDKHPALIFINAEETPAERACTLAYEQAHLSPNNWVDSQAEAEAPDAH